jgi:PBP1b-binding outer membrane lipoprotein LpoB
MMRLRHLITVIIIGTAIIFVGCQDQAQAPETVEKEQKQSKKEPEMYEASELAALMRSMYDRNLELGSLQK